MTPEGLKQLRYGRVERERRWLLAGFPDLAFDSHCDVEDRYLPGTRLRLRRMIDHHGVVADKLARKLPPHTAGAGVMGNLYLDPAEHALLAGLPAHVVCKRRHLAGAWSVDVFAGPLAGLVTVECEVDDDDALAALTPPFPVLAEVTSDVRFSGARLAMDPAAALAAARSLGARLGA